MFAGHIIELGDRAQVDCLGDDPKRHRSHGAIEQEASKDSVFQRKGKQAGLRDGRQGRRQEQRVSTY